MILRGFSVLVMLVMFVGCASSPEVKQLKYAKLSSQRTFEYEFPVVWKGIEAALRNNKIKNRDPEEVSPKEMNQITKRTLETDWIYGQSRDKYIEYKVNDSPRKKHLKTRFKYMVTVNKNIGGADVIVGFEEEIEELNQDGTPKGFTGTDLLDTSRASELLDRINQSILASP